MNTCRGGLRVLPLFGAIHESSLHIIHLHNGMGDSQIAPTINPSHRPHDHHRQLPGIIHQFIPVWFFRQTF